MDNKQKGYPLSTILYPLSTHGVNIAITTDWLVTKGGAERVITEMLKIWPSAKLYTTVYKKEVLSTIHYPLSTHLYSTTLQKWYRLLGNHRILLPLMPRAVESWDMRSFDVILSSSHAVAKGCIPLNSARHICYCHTPMRYIWEMEEEYLEDFNIPKLLRPLVRRAFAKLRRWDLTTAKRVDQFIANSHETANRIRKIYRRESIVLHPPVDDRFFQNQKPAECPGRETRNQKPYFIAVGRLVPYKRFDLAIEAANRERFKLKIAGVGPDRRRLEKHAGDSVEFLGHVPEEELPTLYTNARATIFPVHEDAGIVPLESQACGTPVIAYGKGGVLDTVVACESSHVHTGVFFDEQTVGSLIEAMKKFETMQFDFEKIREHAKQFSSERFREKLQKIITAHWGAQ